MFRVSTGASFGLRCGTAGLLSALILVSIGTASADARGKRKFFKRAAASASYEPRYADIVVDANTGDVLHSTNPDAQRHPASLTKIMTLYLLFERLESGKLKLDTPFEVSAHASSQAPSKLGLRPGQSIQAEDAIKALVTKSANDVAVVVAEALAGSEDEFAKQMTRKARNLRMSRTTYTNASGLPDPDQVTTARDQALLGLAIQDRFPRYYRYFATQSFAYRGVRMSNHNKLLGRVEGVHGIKTGYIRASGFNLVSAVNRGDRRIVAVVLGGQSAGARDARMRSLIEQKVTLASVKRTAPKIVEVADAAPTLQAQKPVRVASADATVPTRNEPLPKPDTRSQATIEQPERPVPGSTEPIKPLLVKTLSVKAGSTKVAAAMSMLSPEPIAARAPVASAEIPQVAAKPETPPPGARPGVLGVLTSKDIAARTVTASIAPVTLPAAVPRAETPVSDSKPRNGWIIQIGAFEDQTEARERLADAKSKAGSVLGAADPYTEVHEKGDKRYFRARFAGLKQYQAESACRQLQKNQIACFAVRN